MSRRLTRGASGLAGSLLAGGFSVGGVVHRAAAQAAVPGRDTAAATTWATVLPHVTGRVLFHPPPNAKAPATSYTRVIRLAHNASANGRLLATFEYHGAGGFPIYESRDDGRTWSAAPIAMVRGTVHNPASGWRYEWQPALYELPAPAGDLPAGTILLAGNDVNFADVQNNALQLYASTDLGRSWSFRGTIESSPPHGGGVWEPEIAYINGQLVVFYSSERHKNRGYNQLLAHRTSLDGGRSWSAETFDVAVADSVQRPGMAVVSRLPSGAYVMTFEVCPRDRCPAHIKRSADGLHWGNPADVGQPVRTRGGIILAGTPYNTWTPAGGLTGAVVVSAHDEAGVSGRRVLLVSTDPALRTWRAIPAPVQWQGGNDHASWSAAVIPTADGRGLLELVSSAFGDGSRNEIRYARMPFPMP